MNDAPKDLLRQMIEFASAEAEIIFKRKGELAPLWHAVRANGSDLILSDHLRDKDRTVAMLRAIFQIESVVRYVFFDECWIVDYKGKAVTPELLRDYHKIPPSKHPDRKEIVQFCAEDKTRAIVAYRNIIRPDRGKAKLAPLEFWPDAMDVEGRMVGLLRPIPTKH